GYGAEFVEAVYQHAFRVEIGESEGAVYGAHAAFPSPAFDRVEQRLRHLEIFDEVDEAEADELLARLAVADVVDDSCHPSDDPPVATGDEYLMVVYVQRRI